MNKESIILFKSITQDNNISDTEIIKYLNWGNNDLQQALNYYFRKLEKNIHQSKSNSL
jgi:hypothetical protein